MALCISSQPSSSDHRARPSLASSTDMMRSSTSPAAFARHHRYPAHSQLSPAGSPPSQSSSPGGSALGTPSRFYQASPLPSSGDAGETLLPQEQQVHASIDGPTIAPTFLQMQPRRPTWLPADQQDELLDDEPLAAAEPPVRGTARAIARGASWTGSASAYAVFGGRHGAVSGDGVLGGEPLSSESVCPIPAVNWKEESAMSDEARRSITSAVCPIAPQDWRALSRTSSASNSEHDAAASSVLSTAAGLAGSCGASTSPGSVSSAGSSPLHRSPLHSGPLQSTSSCPLPADVLHGALGSASAGSGFSAIGASNAYASIGTIGKEPGAVANGVSGVVPTAVPLHVSLREQLLRANSGSCAYQGPTAARPAISRMAMSCSNSRQSSGNFAGYSQSSNCSPARDSMHGSEDTGSNGGVNWQELDDLCQSMDAAGIKIEQIDLTPLDDALDDVHGHASAAAASFSGGSGRNEKVSAAPEAGEGAAPVKYAVKFGGMSMWHSPSH